MRKIDTIYNGISIDAMQRTENHYLTYYFVSMIPQKIISGACQICAYFA